MVGRSIDRSLEIVTLLACAHEFQTLLKFLGGGACTADRYKNRTTRCIYADNPNFSAPARKQVRPLIYRLNMAVSKAAQEKIETTNGLDLIWESRALYADILFCFRECHDLCVSSELFTKEIILQVDQCAVDFRQLSLDTVTVAKRVSNQWLDTAIAFFENIDDVDDPKEMLVLLGNQARELARCFKIIAAWARDLGGRFHEAQGGTIKEVEEFKKAFAAAEQRAEEVRKQMAEQHTKAAKLRREAQETEDKWKTAQVAVSWIPIGAIVTGIGAGIAEKKTAEASRIEREASEKLRQSEEELRTKQSQNEKAKVNYIILNGTYSIAATRYMH